MGIGVPKTGINFVSGKTGIIFYVCASLGSSLMALTMNAAEKSAASGLT